MNNQTVFLLNIIPIELFNFDQRKSIVQFCILFLNATIYFYNKLFRCSQSIMRILSIGIFLFVYSIIPLISFALSVGMTMYLLDHSLIELYELSLEKKPLFISFGMGFLLFYVVEMLIIIWFEGDSIIESLESYLIQKINTGYSQFVNWLRNYIISSYRNTGWDVLNLLVKQQHERSYALNNASIEHNIPTDIVKLIDSFLFDEELVQLSNSRNKIDTEEEKNSKIQNKAQSLKPYDIFEMYTSTVH
eukprot:429545_1